MNSQEPYRLSNIDLSNIDFLYQHEPLGTGHAVQCCLTELNQLQHNSITLILC